MSPHLLPPPHHPTPNHSNKTSKERKGDPPFATMVEILSRSRWRIHMSVADSVDAILAGRWGFGGRGLERMLQASQCITE